MEKDKSGDQKDGDGEMNGRGVKEKRREGEKRGMKEKEKG